MMSDYAEAINNHYGQDVLYLNYWSDSADLSFSVPPAECRAALLDSEFKEIVWRDVSEEMKKGSPKRQADRAKATVGFCVLAKVQSRRGFGQRTGGAIFEKVVCWSFGPCLSVRGSSVLRSIHGGRLGLADPT